MDKWLKLVIVGKATMVKVFNCVKTRSYSMHSIPGHSGVVMGGPTGRSPERHLLRGGTLRVVKNYVV